MESEKDTVFSTMLMGPSMRATGRTTWSKGLPSTRIRMVKFHIWCLTKTECWSQGHLSNSNKTIKKSQTKSKLSRMLFRNVFKFSTCFIPSTSICKPSTIYCSGTTRSLSFGIKGYQISMTNNLSIVLAWTLRGFGKWLGLWKSWEISAWHPLTEEWNPETPKFNKYSS